MSPQEVIELVNNIELGRCNWWRSWYTDDTECLRFNAERFIENSQRFKAVGTLIFVKPQLICAGWFLGQAQFKIKTPADRGIPGGLAAKGELSPEQLLVEIMVSGKPFQESKNIRFFVVCEGLEFQSADQSEAIWRA
jgi:hypothetical protein